MIALIRRLMVLFVLCFLFVLRTSCDAQPTQIPKPNFLQDEKKHRNTEENKFEIDHDLYAYFLPFLKDQSVIREYSYNYYENDYPSYEAYEKPPVGNANTNAMTTSTVGSHQQFIYETSKTTTTSQGLTEPSKTPGGTTKVDMIEPRDQISTLKQTVDQNLCLQQQQETDTASSRLFLCSQKDTFGYACVGPNHRIGTCKEFSDLFEDFTPMCVRKEKHSYIVVCSGSDSEGFCFIDGNGKDMMIPCKEKRRRACFLEDGSLEYCHDKHSLVL